MKDVEHLINNQLLVRGAVMHSMDIVQVSISTYGGSMRNLKGAGIHSCPCIDRVRAEGVKGQLLEKPYFCPYFHVPGIGLLTRRDKVADFIKLMSRAHDSVGKGQNVCKDREIILTRNAGHMDHVALRQLVNVAF
jgi:hypothetical protein